MAKAMTPKQLNSKIKKAKAEALKRMITLKIRMSNENPNSQMLDRSGIRTRERDNNRGLNPSFFRSRVESLNDHTHDIRSFALMQKNQKITAEP